MKDRLHLQNCSLWNYLESPSVREVTYRIASIQVHLFHLWVLFMDGSCCPFSICSSQMAFTVTQTSCCCKRDVIWGEWKLGLSFSQAFVMFFVTAIQKQLVNLMRFPDTGSAQAISLSSHPFLCPSHNLWWKLYSLLVSMFWTWYVVKGVCLLPR